MPAGAAMKIVVNDQVHLSEFHSSDKPALVEHLNDPNIYDRTLRIPFPYTEADANEWLALVTKITKDLQASAGGIGSLVGTGGMITKILAARIANASGEHVVIAKGSTRNVLTAILKGQDEGTLFLAPSLPHEKRLRWMPFTDKGLSELVLKDAAIKRIKRNRSSLQPADMVAVHGQFNAGDVVRLADTRGKTWAKGICRLSSRDCLRVKGKELMQVEKMLGRLPHEELVAFEDIAFRRAL